MIKIPKYAKQYARKALEKRDKLQDYKKFGLDKEEAKVLGINSGVERAKQIIRSNKLSKEDTKRVAAFYNRFKNCKTEKCEGAIDLWGGRKFGRKLSSLVKKKDYKN